MRKCYICQNQIKLNKSDKLIIFEILYSLIDMNANNIILSSIILNIK